MQCKVCTCPPEALNQSSLVLSHVLLGSCHQEATRGRPADGCELDYSNSRITARVFDQHTHLKMDTSMIEPRVDFFGLRIPSAKAASLAPQLHSEDGCTVSIHITQVALGASAAAGPHTVFAVRDKADFAIGTLEQGRCDQFAVDFMCTTAVVFRHSGRADVYLTGYRYVAAEAARSLPLRSDQGCTSTAIHALRSAIDLSLF